MLKLNNFQNTTMNNKPFLQKLPDCYENPKTVMEIYAEDAVLNRQDSTTGQWNEFKKVWLSGYAQPKICCTFICLDAVHGDPLKTMFDLSYLIKVLVKVMQFVSLFKIYNLGSLASWFNAWRRLIYNAVVNFRETI